MQVNTKEVRPGPVSLGLKKPQLQYVAAVELDSPALATLTGVLDSACVLLTQYGLLPSQS